MKSILQDLEKIRQYSGNMQIAILGAHKSDLLKQVLEYTYNPHKKYKIDEGKFDKIQVSVNTEKELTEHDWEHYTELLDELTELKSAKDEHVYKIKNFIYSFKEQDFLKMVLFKDLRLNMNLKKFQKVWSDFCVQPQVQLAQKFEGVKYAHSMYSRKLDGVRCYYKQGLPISRTNKLHKQAPLSHITKQLSTMLDIQNWILDGEIIYLNPDGSEDFKKAISLARSDERTLECDNLYFCVFDMVKHDAFMNKTPDVPFAEEYQRMKAHLGIVEEKRDWFTTSLPNVLLLKQVEEDELEELQTNRFKYNYEGIMIRNAEASYEYKRSSNIRKIKEMQDIEVKLIEMEPGTGKFVNTLGAFIADYNGYKLKIGSGFSDEQRQEYWNNKDKYLNHYVKVKYFEKTTNQQGGESLRFPIFQCFRNMDTMEEFLKI